MPSRNTLEHLKFIMDSQGNPAVRVVLSDVFKETDFLTLTPTASVDYAEGRIYYDTDKKALTYYNDESDVSLQVGRELWIRARNETGATIMDGKAVYISGGSGQLPTVDLATSNAASASKAQMIGLSTHQIEHNSNGYIATFGEVRNQDTEEWAEGAKLYLSPTESGSLTDIEPVYPDFSLLMGRVQNSNSQNGVILVTPGPTDVTNNMVINSASIVNTLRVGGNFVTDGYLTSMSNANVSLPPTVSELNASFGSASLFSAGYTRYINDSGSGDNVYLVASDGTNWHSFSGSKAI